MSHYHWPGAAALGHIVPKHKIYAHAGASSALKERFVAEVQQIRWAYKLSPETTRLNPTDALGEFQVFRLEQRAEQLSVDILEAIDQAIPSPILFELHFDGYQQLAAAYKRPHAQGGNRWVISEYFHTPWQPADAEPAPLPHAIDLEKLYFQLLTRLIDRITIEILGEAIGKTYLADAILAHSYDGRDGQKLDAAEVGLLEESFVDFALHDAEEPLAIEAQIQRLDAIKKQARAIQKLERHVRKEKQFNKRVALNRRLKDARRALINSLNVSSATIY